MASKKCIEAAVKYLKNNLKRYRPGTPQFEHEAAKVRASGKPMRTAKQIIADLDRPRPVSRSRGSGTLDASDVQALWVKVKKRQKGFIYPEQEPRFRALDRLALLGQLEAGDLAEADKIFRQFHRPTFLDAKWVKDELEAELALSGARAASKRKSAPPVSLPLEPSSERRPRGRSEAALALAGSPGRI
jgi:hypothetical protein